MTTPEALQRREAQLPEQPNAEYRQLLRHQGELVSVRAGYRFLLSEASDLPYRIRLGFEIQRLTTRIADTRKQALVITAEFRHRDMLVRECIPRMAKALRDAYEGKPIPEHVQQLLDVADRKN